MFKNRFFGWFLVTAFCIGLSGCGAIQTWRASSSKYDTHGPEVKPDPQTQKELRDLAHKFGLMALFAKVVYRDDLPENERTGAGCKYLSSGNDAPKAVPDYGMPNDNPSDTSGGSTNRWLRWDRIINPAGPPCMDTGGLYYETYIHLDSQGKLDAAVIAFRGTENHRTQIVQDWTTNFAAAFGFEPSEYALARGAMKHLLPALVQRFKESGTPVKIFTTGHSLGGGLAQQLGYLTNDVSEVVTFNTSPVTNWTALRFAKAVENDFPTIYRLEHGGEFLGFPRFVATTATKARYNRYDIGLQIDDKSLVKGHAIALFACEFAKLVGQGDFAQAEHFYPKIYADYISRDEPHRPASNDRAVCEP
jgi:hypothetical protein